MSACRSNRPGWRREVGAWRRRLLRCSLRLLPCLRLDELIPGRLLPLLLLKRGITIPKALNLLSSLQQPWKTGKRILTLERTAHAQSCHAPKIILFFL